MNTNNRQPRNSIILNEPNINEQMPLSIFRIQFDMLLDVGSCIISVQILEYLYNTVVFNNDKV